MLKVITLLIFLFIAVSCGYEKEKVGPAPVSAVGNNHDRVSLPQRIIDTSTEIRLGRNHPLMKKDIFALMDVFFSSFVEKELNSEGNLKDTAVNFDGMYLLRLQRDLNFLKLVSAIESKMADPLILSERDIPFQLAFHINAYNYFAIRLINKNYLWEGNRINSILDLGGHANKLNIFNKKIFMLEGEILSLNDILNIKISKLTKKVGRSITFRSSLCLKRMSIYRSGISQAGKPGNSIGRIDRKKPSFGQKFQGGSWS